jgi:hypothetical protein
MDDATMAAIIQEIENLPAQVIQPQPTDLYTKYLNAGLLAPRQPSKLQVGYSYHDPIDYDNATNCDLNGYSDSYSNGYCSDGWDYDDDWHAMMGMQPKNGTRSGPQGAKPQNAKPQSVKNKEILEDGIDTIIDTTDNIYDCVKSIDQQLIDIHEKGLVVGETVLCVQEDVQKNMTQMSDVTKQLIVLTETISRMEKNQTDLSTVLVQIMQDMAVVKLKVASLDVKL